jgi:hypothetical protein
MYYKYPRTPHLPWSPGRTKDDMVLVDVNHLEGRPLVAMIKYDGENTTLYRDYMHARSLDSKDHPSRHWVKGFHSRIKDSIFPGWRICGENLYAVHSIRYDDLTSYFLGFSVWTDNNTCLKWAETLIIFDDLHICTPEQFTPDSVTSLKEIDAIYHEKYGDKHEGYVVRVRDEFKYEDFGRSVAKYVRANHVQTDRHWMYKEVISNKLWKPTWTEQE